jgi:protein-L-isoaspartate(D-aspartate) O-methyltransferase
MNSTPMLNTEAECEQMIAQQVRTWEVLDGRVLEAMHMVAREPFVPAPWRSLAYADCALPLPCGKHMLTPMLAGRILQALEIQPGDQALEIGTGSGYLTACLAALGASVQSLELHAELAEQARSNLRAAGTQAAEVTCTDGTELASEGAFDAIVLTASLPIYLPRFERALRIGGRLFVVVGTAPIMQARLVRRLGPDAYSSKTLFETSLEALEHAPAPPLFRF